MPDVPRPRPWTWQVSLFMRQFRSTRTFRQGYSGARPDVARMISGQPARVLDVGCGAGQMKGLLEGTLPRTKWFGVEPDQDLAREARAAGYEIVEGGVDDPEALAALSSFAPFDLIICADVLEHLSKPDEALSNVVNLLNANGRVVTSIPNVRHISTFISLGLLGTWPARDRGIHDRTHLRFFARKDILRLGKSAGLNLIREKRNLRLSESRAWTLVPAKALDFWPFRPFFTFQYLHLWEKESK